MKEFTITVTQQANTKILSIPELDVAVTWWMERLNKEQLTVEQLEMFRDNLLKLLLKKFEGHWYPETPERGNGFRSLLFTPRGLLDKVLLDAAQRSYIGNVQRRFGDDSIVMWIDPGQVAVKDFHSNESTTVLYSSRPSSLPSTTSSSPQKNYYNNNDHKKRTIVPSQNKSVFTNSSVQSRSLSPPVIPSSLLQLHHQHPQKQHIFTAQDLVSHTNPYVTKNRVLKQNSVEYEANIRHLSPSVLSTDCKGGYVNNNSFQKDMLDSNWLGVWGNKIV